MLGLSKDILAHLEAEGTIVVPSRQRAVALRLAHSYAMLAAGRRVWNSPDVLPWSAWVERELEQARARGEPMARRLSGAEEWLLWREAVHEACTGLDVLMPDELIETVRRAIRLLDDYELALTSAVTPEVAVLLRARSYFKRRCSERQVLGTTSWRDCAPWLRPSAQLLLAGFAALGPARRRWLESHGARVRPADADWDGATLSGGAPQVAAFDDPSLEAEAAAQWCARMLERDARARLLLVVPRLAEQRHQWQRALSQRLDYRSILARGAPEDAPEGVSSYAIEGGMPLADYPLVASALALIALAAGEVQFSQLSALLRSPYWAALPRHQCLRIEIWLREHNVPVARAGELQALLPVLSSALGEAAAAVLQILLAAVEALARTASTTSGVATPALWAQAFVALLRHCGWPGEASLGSQEQQVRLRFDELLGEFGAIMLDAPGLALAEAAELLQQLARRSLFEPASDDVPVTLTNSIDDPIVHYDGIWVAGLSSEQWPPPARPEALIPLPLQYAAAVSAASPAGQLQLAAQALRQWQHASTHCVLSWPRTDADLPREPSPLLRELTVAHGDLEDDAAGAFNLHRWIAAQAPALQIWRDERGPAWPTERRLRGGARLLELQSLCPFRSFAELRLQARAVPAPAPGIDPRLRGQMLHRALELFWSSTRDWATLRDRSIEASLAVARRCIERAIQELSGPAAASLPAMLLRQEAARSAKLLARLIEWELTREPFEVELLESAQPLTIAGATLQLRLDRVDRLRDARRVVIDYKSGAAAPFDPWAQRPPQPQLPAYASAVGDETCAVASVHLGTEAVKLRGVSDRKGRIRGVRALPEAQPEWSQLRLHWHQQLQVLLQEFLSGQAAVQPQAHACDYCHLSMLCRIDPAAAQLSVPPVSEEGEEGRPEWRAAETSA